MGILERMESAKRGRTTLAKPGFPGVSSVSRFGHQSQFAIPEYGDYLVTSNEVFSAAMLRARLMSSLTLRTYRGDRTDPDRKEVTRGPATELLRHVNPFWSRRRLERMDELSMCLWGQTFWAIEKDGFGEPREIWWMKPTQVEPEIDDKSYLAGFWYTPIGGGERIWFGADEVVWFRYPNPLDEFAPLSPVAAARLAADTASAMMQSNRNLFLNGLQMGGFITPVEDKVTFEDGQAEDLELALARRFRGVDKAHRWAVLRFEAQFKEANITPKDAEFANGLNLTLRQVGNAYGIPIPLLNDMSGATLTNVREYQKLLWSHALVPDSQMRADEISEQLLPMFGQPMRARPDAVDYDYSSVEALQEAMSDQWGRERQAIEVGRYTINEIRAKAGEPPVPWGDVWWAPVNKSSVNGPASAPQGDTAPAGDPVDEEQASSLMASLDMSRLEIRHGRMAINGKVNGHGSRP